MYKSIILSLLAIGIFSCKNSEKKIDKIEIAKQYFKVLDKSDYAAMSVWFADSLTTIEGDYEQTYSQSDYLKFLKWDAVFDPTYEILEIAQKDETVKAKISKLDKRISFLHEKPFITNQTLNFQNEKIISVETDYETFDQKTWEKNKTALLTWIEKNHPELNGFIYDQTEAGGVKFLKAIELYKTKE